ncbi:hypothetical protein CJ739_86 [Mariniflexile rhizosphaerae]|uniref:hypothetical protein n=1 Tax=unclassified Mariniflexile TaxID=2643887 RepID=UPI000E337553|nr:hypothetical protein [Mariniflexile sp. TRM1-10]AXP79186.1 hypothetical protein CJ739_86 [Mariniflexile sp. TRM1-10]
MKFKLFARTIALMTALFSWGENVPIVEGRVNLDDDQKQKLQETLGENLSVEEVLKGINKEIADAAAGDAGVQAAKEELKALLDKTDLTEAEKKQITDPDPGAEVSLADQLKKVNKEVGEKLTEMNEKIMKLVINSEGDTPADIIDKGLKGEKIQHSATHLFGSSKIYDAFADRPWNKRAAGLTNHATDFSDKIQVEKLNGDVELFYRENPDKIASLIRDNFGLPSFWPKRLNVDDRVSDGTIVTAEITQARKLPWLPKNKQKIETEEGKIFPVQIDAEFIGFNLQKMESSWLNSYNKEGSQAYKMSFVQFLLSELDKRARIEDRVSTISGVYVATPENATTAASFMQRQDGLLYQIWKAINVTKKLKPFDLGLPTTSNIVDYVDSMIKALPDEVRIQQGLKFYLSDEWLRAYKRRYEQIHGSYTDYTGYPKNPKDYTNIDFEAMPDFSGLDIMFITFSDNIEILENIPAEKSKYHFEMLKRIIYIFADYKLGVRLIHIGTTVKDGDPDEFKVQSVWSNNAPAFKADYFIPVYDDTTGKVSAKYSNLTVDAAWATAITEFTGTYENQIIKIKGNTSLAGAVNVTDGAKINLAGDAPFDLKSGGTLTLIAAADGSVTEIKRTTAPATAPSTTVNFSGTTVDANAGTVFQYTGGAATLVSITGGTEGKVIKIMGAAASALTVEDVPGNINVSGDAVMDADGDFVELILVDGVWEEKSRTIAA